MIADVDRDFDLDTYVANDTTENFLYLNNGSGQFEETALINGAAGDDSGAPNGSMGVDVGDFNGDGRFDLWVANYVEEPFALYRNMGGGLFQHVSRSTGINVLGGLYVGFGTGFADLDRDGDEDLVVANGHVFEHPATAPIHQLPLLLRNDDGHYTVLKFSPNKYFSTPHLGRGLALGDLDHDGDIDVAVSHLQAPVAVIRNDDSNSKRWLQLRLIGRTVSRTPIGATATLHTSRGDMVRTVIGGGSYLSHNDCHLAWGIPADAQVRHLTIAWPDGSMQRIDAIETEQVMICVQP